MPATTRAGRPRVLCHRFVSRRRPEDRVRQDLVPKTAIIRRELGRPSPAIPGRLATLLGPGMRHRDAAGADPAPRRGRLAGDAGDGLDSSVY
jgi:hypothetical protein